MNIPTSKSQLPNPQKAFTLIELILYMALISIMLSALLPFAFNIVGVSAKSNTQQEVFSQARFISERIKYEIRNASGITSVSANSITLTNSVPANNPTIIDLSGGVVRIKQGAGAVTNLSSPDVTVSSLTFTNNTSGDSKTKNISFGFTINANYSSSRQEFVETTSIRSSAEIRSN